jgi:hypothetical protein
MKDQAFLNQYLTRREREAFSTLWQHACPNGNCDDNTDGDESQITARHGVVTINQEARDDED